MKSHLFNFFIWVTPAKCRSFKEISFVRPRRFTAFVFQFIFVTTLISSGIVKAALVNDNTSKPSISEIGPNSRKWIIQHPNPKIYYGTANIPDPQSTVMEVASGMHYWDGQKWSKSNPSFQGTENGFIATNTQHKVRLAADIYSANAVSVTTRDGLVLNSIPYGIALYDTATSNLLLIATITNSVGIQVSSNQILYPSAFNGVCADLVYTMQKGSFQQDVLLTGKLDPTAYGFPTETTCIQIVTELINSPNPVIQYRTMPKVKRSAIPRQVDQRLAFGEMIFGRGYAFLSESNFVGQNIKQRISVAKELVDVGERRFLVESLAYGSAQPILQNLPDCAPVTTSLKTTSTNKFFALKSLPKFEFKAFKSPEKLANHLVETSLKKSSIVSLGTSSLKLKRGLLVDYTATIGTTISNDFTFQSDTTYFISGGFSIGGTTTFEGGAILKYPAGGGEVDPGDYVFKGSGYRPIIFTASDDDSVGSSMNGIDPGYTGTITEYDDGGVFAGGYGNYLGVMSGTISNARMSYADFAIDGYPDVMENSQIMNCGFVCFFGNDTTFNNCLLTSIRNLNYDGNIMTFNQCSVDNIFSLNTGYVFATNSIFSVNSYDTNSAIFSGSYNGFWDNPNGLYFGDHSTFITGGMYQSSGAGNFYLLQDDFRNYGTTNIDPNLLAYLKTATTYPPYSLNTNIIANTTLTPVVPRDTNSTATDLGYHYPPIDYITTYCQVSNATLSLTNGVVIAYYDSFGIWLENGGNLNSVGTPLDNNTIVYYRNVQEQPTNLWSWSTNDASYAVQNSYPILLYSTVLSNFPNINLQFTTIAGANGASWFFSAFDGNSALGSLTLTNCEMYAAGGEYVVNLYDSAPTVIYKNDLWHRPLVFFSENTNSTTTINNLFVGDGGTNTFVNIYCTTAGIFPGTNLNNAFDACYVHLDGQVSNNAYLNSSSYFNMSPEANSIITNIAWATGPSGYFYQSNACPLIDHGNLTADQLGLYQYTTTTNQVKETNSIVDMGYHYVALGTNGLPFDSNGDGIADYAQDLAGNGGIVVTLTTPTNNSFFLEPATIGLVATVTNTMNSSVFTNLAFYHESIYIGATNNTPYIYSWPIVPAGSYILTAVAQFSDGLNVSSAPIIVNVTNFCTY